jgi:hypothetical protein
VTGQSCNVRSRAFDTFGGTRLREGLMKGKKDYTHAWDMDYTVYVTIEWRHSVTDYDCDFADCDCDVFIVSISYHPYCTHRAETKNGAQEL